MVPLTPLTTGAILGLAWPSTLAFGVWLSRLGRPYNGLLFDVHKLMALGAVVVTILGLSRIEAADSLALALLVLAGVSAAALFATGALLSLGKLGHGRMRTVHCIASVAMVLSVAPLVYRLASKP